MELELLTQPMAWHPEATATMQELGHDWYGSPMVPPAQFRLVEDPHHLWLIAAHEAAAKPHPKGDCGDFQAELWRHDVAELFIAQADGPHYLEFNLSPRGAWWMACFSGPRQLCPMKDLPEVITHTSVEGAGNDDGSWKAVLGIPLDWLRESISWGAGSPLNVAFILKSPDQRFLSTCNLGDGEPDFHRPQRFAIPRRKGALD